MAQINTYTTLSPKLTIGDVAAHYTAIANILKNRGASPIGIHNLSEGQTREKVVSTWLFTLSDGEATVEIAYILPYINAENQTFGRLY